MKTEANIENVYDHDTVPAILPRSLMSGLRAMRPSRRSFPVQTKLELPTQGLYGYKLEKHRWAIERTVAVVKEVGRIWALRGHLQRLGVGDLSKRGGGDIPDHGSHETGRDVDMDMLRNDGTETDSGRITYLSPRYSRNLTQELIDLWHANGVAALIFVLFNDSQLTGVRRYDGHDNHLHFRLAFPGQGTIFPTLEHGSNGAAVRELQRRLNFWNSSLAAPTPSLSIDGDFGTSTKVAVRAFQNAAGISASGKVLSNTWRALPVA
jgi:hypothetical protein